MLYTIYTKIDNSLGFQYTKLMTKKQKKIEPSDYPVNAKELRQNMSAILDSLEEKRYLIVTRYGRPKGVLVDYEYFSPRMTMSQKECERGFDRMREIISQSKSDMTEQEAYDFIDEVKQEIRAEKRAAKAKKLAQGKKDD